MNWTAIGAVGEIAGALAVVVSLIYLARQISNANRLMRAEAFRNPNSDLNSLNASFGTDPDFRAAWMRLPTAADRESVPPEERVALDIYLVSIANVFSQLVREVEEGILDAAAIDRFGAQRVFQTPYFRSSWPLYARTLSENFVRFAEARYDLDPGDSDPSLWYGPAGKTEADRLPGGTSV